MPKKEKTLAENIANLGEDSTLSGFIASIEEIGKKDPEKLAAAGGFVQSLKNLNSGKKDLVQGAINSLNDIYDWLIERGKSGKTNYEELAEALGKDKMRELILYLNRKLGLDLEPDALAKGLKKLKQLDGNNFGADAADMGERYSSDNVHEEANMPDGPGPEQFDVFNSEHYKKSLEQADFEGNDYNNVRDTVLYATAGFVNLKILQRSGKKLTEKEFIESTNTMIDSPAFRQTILENGGESMDGLKNVSRNFLKDGGKRFYADFMQNSLHQKQREEQYIKIRQDAQKQRELEMNKPKPEHVLGQNV